MQLGIYGVVQHDWRWYVAGLSSVPGGFGLVNLGWQRLMEPPIVDGLLQSTLPTRFAELDQTFFALSRFRIWNTSWMMLLLFSGDKAISSLAAATTIQKAG